MENKFDNISISKLIKSQQKKGGLGLNNYDYSKLKGKIKECFSTQAEFAQKLGISDASLSYKLNNKTVFDQNQIQRAIEIFNLKPNEINDYFFYNKS